MVPWVALSENTPHQKQLLTEKSSRRVLDEDLLRAQGACGLAGTGMLRDAGHIARLKRLKA